jgi:hypothetical protein
MTETLSEQRVDELLAPLRRLEPAGLPQRRKPRRTLRALALAVPLALVALVVGIRPGSGAKPSPEQVLARAAAATLAPAESVRHSVYVDRVARTGCELRSEWWTTTSRPFQERNIEGYADGYQVDWALVQRDDAIVEQLYDAAADTIYEATTETAGLTFQDPATPMRQAIEAGTATITGESTLDGRAVWVVQGGGVRYLVDETTYETLELIVRQNGGETTRRTSAEYLPATDDNLALLDERRQHPTATVVSVTASEWHAQSDRLRAGHPWCTP